MTKEIVATEVTKEIVAKKVTKGIGVSASVLTEGKRTREETETGMLVRSPESDQKNSIEL